MDNTQTPIILSATLERAWALPENPDFPASAGAELIAGGRAIRLYGALLRTLIGKPQGTPVNLGCSFAVVTDKWGKQAIRLKVEAVDAATGSGA